MSSCVRGWFDPKMVRTLRPTCKCHRQQSFSDEAVPACLTIKVLFGVSLRQATGLAESLLRLVGLDRAVPDFSTLCRRHQTLNVSLPYRGASVHSLALNSDCVWPHACGALRSHAKHRAGRRSAGRCCPRRRPSRLGSRSRCSRPPRPQDAAGSAGGAAGGSARRACRPRTAGRGACPVAALHGCSGRDLGRARGAGGAEPIPPRPRRGSARGRHASPAA